MPDAALPAPRRSVPLLADRTAGRDNNVLAIRFAAAAIVILFHCYALTDRWTDEPLYAAFAPMNLGVLGVQVFFVLSGFLVTQSWLARPSPVPYAAARVLRIYPALVAATVFTIVVAGATGSLPWREYLASPTTWRYFVRTATGFDGRHSSRALEAMPQRTRSPTQGLPAECGSRHATCSRSRRRRWQATARPTSGSSIRRAKAHSRSSRRLPN